MRAKKERNSFSFKAIVIMTAAALVLICAAGYYYRSELGSIFSAITGFLGGGSSANEISYTRYSDSTYRAIGNSLAVVSSRGVQVVSGGGKSAFDENYDVGSPACDINGDKGVIFDIGGNTAKVFTESGIIFEIETKNPIINAGVNSAAYLAVCTTDPGYNGLVSVYDETGKLRYEWFSGEAYVLKAQISPDSKTLAVLGITEAGSRAVFLDLATGEEKGRYDAAAETMIDIAFEDSETLAAVSTTKFTTLDTKGNVQSTLGFGGKYLREYCLGESDVHVVILSEYQAGDGCEAVVIDGGKEKSTVEGLPAVNEMSVSSGRFAVLTDSAVKVFSKYGREKISFKHDGDIVSIVLAKSGAVFACGTYRAEVLK